MYAIIKSPLCLGFFDSISRPPSPCFKSARVEQIPLNSHTQFGVRAQNASVSGFCVSALLAREHQREEQRGANPSQGRPPPHGKQFHPHLSALLICTIALNESTRDSQNSPQKQLLEGFKERVPRADPRPKQHILTRECPRREVQVEKLFACSSKCGEF